MFLSTINALLLVTSDLSKTCALIECNQNKWFNLNCIK